MDKFGRDPYDPGNLLPFELVEDFIYISLDAFVNAITLRAETCIYILIIQCVMKEVAALRTDESMGAMTFPSSMASPSERISAEPIDRTGRRLVCNDQDITSYRETRPRRLSSITEM